MAVRNCAEIGENLQRIVNRLLSNDNLINLLYYSDKDPLSHESLTEEQKNKEVFGKLIKMVPRIGPKETAQSAISIRVTDATTSEDNPEFKNVFIQIEVFVPMTQWVIKNSNLRPFAILGEIQKSLDKKLINGLGKMTGGDFSINFLTEEIACYEQNFVITSYA